MITINPKIIPNCQYPGTTATLILSISERIVSSDGDIIQPGNYQNTDHYIVFDLTINPATKELSIPEINLASTNDSDKPNAKWQAFINDEDNRPREFFLPEFALRSDLSSPQEWTEIIAYNSGRSLAFPDGFASLAQVVALLATRRGSYVYIAYADAANGSGFTTVFNASKSFIAIKSSPVEIQSPQASDFVGLWMNFKGDAGPAGAQGVQGIQGIQGIQGPQGVPGAPGTNGVSLAGKGYALPGDFAAVRSALDPAAAELEDVIARLNTVIFDMNGTV